jgi:preprotein translocase subunit SecA
MSEPAKDELRTVLERKVEEYTVGDFVEEWDLDELFVQVAQIFPPSFEAEEVRADSLDRAETAERLFEDAIARYEEREQELGSELMRNLERAVLLQIIDNRWQEHLFEMDYLREGIHLRGFAQQDPLVAYKNEGFKFFRELMNSIWEDFAKHVFHIEVEIAPAEAEIAFTPSSRSSSTANFSYTGGGPDQPSALYGGGEGAGVAVAEEGEELAALPEVETRHVDERDRIGRNDPCWCGSGKKFKKCHGQ